MPKFLVVYPTYSVQVEAKDVEEAVAKATFNNLDDKTSDQEAELVEEKSI